MKLLCIYISLLAVTARLSSLLTLCYKTSPQKYGDQEEGRTDSDINLLWSGLVSSSHRISRVFACENNDDGLVQAVQFTL